MLCYYLRWMLLLVVSPAFIVSAFSPLQLIITAKRTNADSNSHFGVCYLSNENKEWTSDFDDFYNDDDQDDAAKFSLPDFKVPQVDNTDDDKPLEDDDDDTLEKLSSAAQQQQFSLDLSGSQSRLFSLGPDLILTDFVGNMGFDEVTDWEYYAQDEDTGEKLYPVQPPPLDPSKPKRTRERVASVIRLFRGEFVGQLGSTLQSQGLDKRVLVKEFSGDLALSLARSELKSMAKLQSALVASRDYGAKSGEWIQTASSRSSVSTRQDNFNLVKLVSILSKEAPFMGILGEVNLAELEEDIDPNEFYRALGVEPPKPGSVWLVYEYTGLSTAAQYSQPASARLAAMPPKRGVFGKPMPPPPLPKWSERANYVVQGIMKGALEAVAAAHEDGVAHRSIGRTSIILSSAGMDKTEASSPLATSPARLRIKLADFGFSGLLEESTMDPDFCSRASSFGLTLRKGEVSDAATKYAMAEDLHALGFVFMGLLLTSLAEPPSNPDYNMPGTDEDTLQRLLGEIFENDMDEFRDYVDAEEDLWSNIVVLLDENDGAGWEVLKSMCLARERAAESSNAERATTARDLLSSPFFRN